MCWAWWSSTMRCSRLASATRPIVIRSSSEIAPSSSDSRLQLLDRLGVALGRGGRGLAVDAVFARGLAHRVAHIGQRQRQHLVAQRLVERRQAIELEQMDDRPQGQPVDEQGEQHEPGRERGDEVLHRRVDVLVLGHRQCQRQRDRAAQPAPDDRDLVGAADLLAQPHRRQYRQQAEQHRRARQQRRDDRDRQQPRVLDDHPVSSRGTSAAGGHEDQRAGPEAGLLPDLFEIFPIVGRQPHAADDARR